MEGESFIIAKSGRPLVKVVPFAAAGADQPKRLGFLVGQIAVPADFNTMASQPREDKTGDEG